MSFSPYLAWVLMLNREYCPVERYSVRCPWIVLLKGIAQKLVAVTNPVLVLRKTFSKSTKPPGVKSAPPMRKDSGDSFGLSWGGRAATFTGLLVFSEALTRRPASAEVESCWGADACFCSFSICCCCWAICCCWAAMASRKALISAATELGSSAAALGAWPMARLEASRNTLAACSNLIGTALLVFDLSCLDGPSGTRLLRDCYKQQEC